MKKIISFLAACSFAVVLACGGKQNESSGNDVKGDTTSRENMSTPDTVSTKSNLPADTAAQ
jgi:hypothetical protein